jgi:hypothetical protein
MKKGKTTKLVVAASIIGAVATFVALAAVCNDNAQEVSNSVNWVPRQNVIPAEDTPTWQDCMLSGPYNENGRSYYNCTGNASLEIFYNPNNPSELKIIKRPRSGNPDGQPPTHKLFIWDNQRTEVLCKAARADCSGRIYQNGSQTCPVSEPILQNPEVSTRRYLYSGSLSACGSSGS